MSHCDKHNCETEYREVSHGKTVEFCPRCEEETQERLRRLFPAKELQASNLQAERDIYKAKLEE